MDSREKFNIAVVEQFENYRRNMLACDPNDIFNMAYEIANTTQIAKFLTEETNDVVMPLYPYAQSIMKMLCDYESHYTSPVWAYHSDLMEMIEDFVRDKEEESHTVKHK